MQSVYWSGRIHTLQGVISGTVVVAILSRPMLPIACAYVHLL